MIIRVLHEKKNQKYFLKENNSSKQTSECLLGTRFHLPTINSTDYTIDAHDNIFISRRAGDRFMPDFLAWLGRIHYYTLPDKLLQPETYPLG